jgi:hypothetical protein
MHLRHTLRLARPRTNLTRAIYLKYRLHTSVEAVNDAESVLPPLPPPSFGTVTERLAQWQVDYDKHTVETVPDEKLALLEKLFPLSSKSARSNGGAEGKDEDGESAMFGAVSTYDSLGSMGEWLEQTFLGPGCLVEIT